MEGYDELDGEADKVLASGSQAAQLNKMCSSSSMISLPAQVWGKAVATRGFGRIPTQ